MSDALITSRDTKGRHAVKLFEDAYNKAGLNEEQAQRLNQQGGKLQAAITAAIRELTRPLRLAGEYKFLSPRAAGTLPATEAFDPATLSQRSDLWFSDNTRKWILPAATPIDALPGGILDGFDLIKNAFDREIKSELPAVHVISASEFLARAAVLTANQPNGKEGDLLVNGYANIWYVEGLNSEVFAVFVRWYADDRLWRFYTYQLVDGQWSAGDRVLLATADALVS